MCLGDYIISNAWNSTLQCIRRAYIFFLSRVPDNFSIQVVIKGILTGHFCKGTWFDSPWSFCANILTRDRLSILLLLMIALQHTLKAFMKFSFFLIKKHFEFSLSRTQESRIQTLAYAYSSWNCIWPTRAPVTTDSGFKLPSSWILICNRKANLFHNFNSDKCLLHVSPRNFLSGQAT